MTVPDPHTVDKERKMLVKIRKLEAENKDLQERIAELQRLLELADDRDPELVSTHERVEQAIDDHARATAQKLRDELAQPKPMPKRGPGGKFLKKEG